MQFKHLHTKIAVTFLTLILIIQLISFSAIRISIEQNARDSISDQLKSGENLFVNLIKNTGENLSDAASILAADFGFRAAIASKDNETISSALENHQARINADIAVFYPSDGSIPSITNSLNHDELALKLPKIVNMAEENGKAIDFILLNNQPYQVVVVPIKAPNIIGWVVMGFEINNLVAHRLSRLSNFEVTFINKTRQQSWSSIASTLYPAATKQLINKSNLLNLNDHKTVEIEIGDVSFGTRYLKLIETKEQAIYVVLQRSISEAVAPFQTLQLNLLILTILGAVIFAIGSILTARRITLPITALAKTADKLARGDYNINIESNRTDEIGNLSRSFKSMTEAIVSREKSILKLAYWDEMTDLPNRASFIVDLNQAIQTAAKNQSCVTVVMIDLDRFKQINNVLGHSIGDDILKLIADRFKSATKNNHDLIARYGGDEFAILLNDVDIDAAISVSRRLLKILDQPIKAGDQAVDISASAGIANYPLHGDSVEQLLSRAEIAMYSAKARNTGVSVFEANFDMSSEENLSLASELKHAIENNQLLLYVQPKINVATGRVDSAEALIRWNHPEKGMIYPDKFIPFAEKTGFIRKISLWMLAEAAAQSATWQSKGHKITIAVNLSARDLIDQSLPSKINTILVLNDIDINAISLEITESSIMDDPTRSEHTLDALSKMGIKLAIDDFGTGYSSLAYLKKLPISELKIDKSFVMKMETDESDRKIVQSTIDLGHNLGLKVVAEGIENIEVWKLLATMGCDYGQGYYMSKPIPADEFIQWVETWNTLKALEPNVFIESPSTRLN